MLNSTSSVINTLLASGADITLDNHTLKITGAPEMDYRLIDSSPGLLVSLAEGLQSQTVTPTAVDSFRYLLTITQYDKSIGGFTHEQFAYTSLASGDTATTISDAFRSMIALNQSLKIAASGTSTLVLTATAGAPLFTVQLGSINLALADSQPTIAMGASTISNAAPRVLDFGIAHGLSTGASLDISGVTGAGAADCNKVHRVTVTGANTVTLDGTTATGTVTSTSATAEIVAQESRGQFSDLVAQGVEGAESGNVYSTLEFAFGVKGVASSAGVVDSGLSKHVVYIKDNDINDADYVALADDIAENLSATLTGGAADPEAVAVA